MAGSILAIVIKRLLIYMICICTEAPLEEGLGSANKNYNAASKKITSWCNHLEKAVHYVAKKEKNQPSISILSM